MRQCPFKVGDDVTLKDVPPETKKLNRFRIGHIHHSVKLLSMDSENTDIFSCFPEDSDCGFNDSDLEYFQVRA